MCLCTWVRFTFGISDLATASGLLGLLLYLLITLFLPPTVDATEQLGEQNDIFLFGN